MTTTAALDVPFTVDGWPTALDGPGLTFTCGGRTTPWPELDADITALRAQALAAGATVPDVELAITWALARMGLFPERGRHGHLLWLRADGTRQVGS